MLHALLHVPSDILVLPFAGKRRDPVFLRFNEFSPLDFTMSAFKHCAKRISSTIMDLAVSLKMYKEEASVNTVLPILRALGSPEVHKS